MNNTDYVGMPPHYDDSKNNSDNTNDSSDDESWGFESNSGSGSFDIISHKEIDIYSKDDKPCERYSNDSPSIGINPNEDSDSSDSCTQEVYPSEKEGYSYDSSSIGTNPNEDSVSSHPNYTSGVSIFIS